MSEEEEVLATFLVWLPFSSVSMLLLGKPGLTPGERSHMLSLCFHPTLLGYSHDRMETAALPGSTGAGQHPITSTALPSSSVPSQPLTLTATYCFLPLPLEVTL